MRHTQLRENFERCKSSLRMMNCIVHRLHALHPHFSHRFKNVHAHVVHYSGCFTTARSLVQDAPTRFAGAAVHGDGMGAWLRARVAKDAHSQRAYGIHVLPMNTYFLSVTGNCAHVHIYKAPYSCQRRVMSASGEHDFHESASAYAREPRPYHRCRR